MVPYKLSCSCSQESLSKLAAGFHQEYSRGATIWLPNEHSRFVILVLSGKVLLKGGTSAKPTALRLAGPDHFLGLASALLRVPNSFGIEMIEGGRIWMVESETIRSCASTDLGLSMLFNAELAAETNWQMTEVVRQKLLSVPERLAAWLLENHPEGTTARLPLAKKDLALLIGTTPEHLAKAFVQLKPFGVEIEGKQVHYSNNDETRSLNAYLRVAQP